MESVKTKGSRCTNCGKQLKSAVNYSFYSETPASEGLPFEDQASNFASPVIFGGQTSLPERVLDAADAANGNFESVDSPVVFKVDPSADYVDYDREFKGQICFVIFRCVHENRR